MDYRADAILRDGRSIRIRSLRSDDKEKLLKHFESLSQRSVYFRFLRTKNRLTEAELAQFTELDFVDDVALVATLREEDEERIIGVGRFSVVSDPSSPHRRAEMAFAVADDHQGRGIGTLLLEHMVPIARASGISEFEADVLGENNQMLQVFATSGFKVARSLEADVFHVSFPTEATAEFSLAQHRRERQAAAQSIRPLLEPGSVAVIGASRQPCTIGNTLVLNLRRAGFRGPIYPVNPKASEIEGVPAYPNVAAIGEPVDLALISVPAPLVEEAVRDCARCGVKGIAVITSGFGEVSEQGREAEERLRELVRTSGMRMVGPNCMGVVNTDPRISLNATFVPAWPPPGNIGMSSQSGALGYVILDRIQSLNIGISSFVSVGNKADVSGNDLLAYWAEDPRTRVIVLYLESFGNPRKFGRVAPEVARRKPIVAVKSGRSAAGTRAASSHSAALASLDVAVGALFEQAGVIRTDTLEQLLDVAILLSTQPIPCGPRVGVITNAGGAGILLADACESQGLVLPTLSAQTVEALRGFLPPQSSLVNPIDMIASATPEQYAAGIEAMGADPNIDSLVIIYVPPLLHPPEEMAKALALAAGKVPLEKPVLTVFMSSRGAPPLLSKGTRGRIPSYSFPENAALALSAAERYGRWKGRPRGSILSFEPVTQSAIRAVIDRVLKSHDQPVWLDPGDMATVLRLAGIEFAAAELTTPEEAAEVSERMGLPLVAKVHSDKVLHKSDVGGVILGLHCRDDVLAAVDGLCRSMKRAGLPMERILLQREVPGGIEALVGVTTDPTFGPLVVCGMGGVLVEIMKDAAFRLTPVSDLDAEEMIAKLRSGRLLEGYRGSPPGDRQALIRMIQQVSALVELVPELRELDLNPVKVLEPGRGAVAVDGRLRVGPIR
jgi:acetyl coenzyme A synthetase (ADP forming)-like protein